MQSQLPNKMLLDERPLIILPQLACKIGLNESIILQQMHYWLLSSEHDHDGRKWIYNSYEEWRVQFPFWSYNTIKRTITKLESLKLLFVGNYNQAKFDQTKWYSIDYQNLFVLCSGDTRNMSHPIGPKWADGGDQNGPTNTIDYTETNTYIEGSTSSSLLDRDVSTLDKDKTTDSPPTPPKKRQPKERLPHQKSDYLLNLPNEEVGRLATEYQLDAEVILKEAKKCYKNVNMKGIQNFIKDYRIRLELWLDNVIEWNKEKQKDNSGYSTELKFDNPPDAFNYSEADLAPGRLWEQHNKTMQPETSTEKNLNN